MALIGPAFIIFLSCSTCLPNQNNSFRVRVEGVDRDVPEKVFLLANARVLIYNSTLFDPTKPRQGLLHDKVTNSRGFVDIPLAMGNQPEFTIRAVKKGFFPMRCDKKARKGSIVTLLLSRKTF